MYKVLKKAFDFFGSLALSMIFSPVIIIIALIIFAEKSGPVLFRQQRPGKDGKLFTIYKFRTMSNETQQKGAILSDMERVTKFGALLRMTSLDELPQLLNVLKGEMSFIGPRPLLTEYLRLYSSRQARRHEVLPGITGYAQVNGRNAITWEQKFEYDVFYVENLSLFLDMKIFAKTFLNVLKREGINSSDNLSMHKFSGEAGLRN